MDANRRMFSAEVYMNEQKFNINDVTDYIIIKLDEARAGINILKLQKLLYYVQAWRLALKGVPLFDGKFQAWVHGPVNRQVYNRFAESHGMYDTLKLCDTQANFDISKIDQEARAHIDEVLDAYASFSGPQLEQMTHSELPWIIARGHRKPSERCETELDEALMIQYFKEELRQSEMQ